MSLISFPSTAMEVADEDMAVVSVAGRAVIEAVKQAGVYVFAAAASVRSALTFIAACPYLVAWPTARSTGTDAISACRNPWNCLKSTG